MSDVNRVAEIARLEEKVRALMAQVETYKADAELWKPVVTSAVEGDGTVKISLRFGGKMLTATLNSSYLASTDLTSATSSVVTTLIDSLVADRLREVVMPEVDRVMKNVQSLQRVSKW